MPYRHPVGCGRIIGLLAGRCTTPDSGTDNGNTIRFTTAIAGFTGSDAAAPAHAPPSTTTVRAASPTATKRRLLESPIQIQGHCLSQKDTPPPTRTERGLPGMTWDEFGEAELVRFSAFSRNGHSGRL